MAHDEARAGDSQRQPGRERGLEWELRSLAVPKTPLKHVPSSGEVNEVKRLCGGHPPRGAIMPRTALTIVAAGIPPERLSFSLRPL